MDALGARMPARVRVRLISAAGTTLEYVQDTTPSESETATRERLEAVAAAARALHKAMKSLTPDDMNRIEPRFALLQARADRGETWLPPALRAEPLSRVRRDQAQTAQGLVSAASAIAPTIARRAGKRIEDEACARLIRRLADDFEAVTGTAPGTGEGSPFVRFVAALGELRGLPLTRARIRAALKGR